MAKELMDLLAWPADLSQEIVRLSEALDLPEIEDLREYAAYSMSDGLEKELGEPAGSNNIVVD